MDTIPFRNFLATYNFRDLYEECDRHGDPLWATKIIRVYYGESLNNEDWFEVGINDFRGLNYTMKQWEKILSSEILNMYVVSIEYSDRLQLLCVYLTNKKTLPD